MKKGELKKIKFFVITFFSVILIFCFFFTQISAQEKEIIDWRCKREKLLRNPADLEQLLREQEREGKKCDDELETVCLKGFEFYEDDSQEDNPCRELLKFCYSDVCKVENNKQSEIVCLEINYPASNKLTSIFGKGGLNFFNTDIILNKSTLPAIIRMIFTVIFASWVIYKLWNAIRAFQYWLKAANSGEDAQSAKTHITNSLVGAAIGVGSLLLTSLIFKLAGYDEPFNFEPDINRLLDVDCKSIVSEDECKQYDLSCELNGDKCQKRDEPRKVQDNCLDW